MNFALIIVIFLSLIGVIADFFLKLSGKGPEYMNITFFIIGLLIYSLTAFGWFYVMKYVKFSTIGVFYAIGTILFLTLTGVFYFKEQLSSYEIIGIAMAIISLILLKKFV